VAARLTAGRSAQPNHAIRRTLTLQLGQAQGQLEVGLGGSWLQPHHLPPTGHRRFMLAKIPQCFGQSAVGCHVVRVDPYRRLKAGGRLFPPAQLPQQLPQVAVRDAHVGLPAQRFSKAGLGIEKPALLNLQDPQVVVCAGMIGPILQCSPQPRFGFLEFVLRQIRRAEKGQGIRAVRRGLQNIVIDLDCLVQIAVEMQLLGSPDQFVHNRHEAAP